MKLSTSISAIMASLPLSSSVIITASGNISLPTTNTTLLGNIYNHWIHLGNKSFDLTRSLVAPTTKPITIPMSGSRKSALIEPSRSALVIIDMQNFFLHPELSPKAEAGRKAVEPTLNMINGFRANGMPVLWVNWGLDERDLLNMPPAFLSGFSNNGISPLDTFGSHMANLSDGTEVGDKLMRGSWNARPYGALYDAQVEGVKNGTDFYFNKSIGSRRHTKLTRTDAMVDRLSGLWGAQTPLGIWLEENQMTTLFFGGVNADQCVWGTLLDAYYKGYDVVYVDDIAATTSPEYATQMVKYNADHGFLSDSSLILSALAGSK